MPSLSQFPDAMSDVLALIRMQGEVVCASEYSAPWSISFRGPSAHFHLVERGSVWLRVGDADAVRLETGDLVVLPLGSGHTLSSDPVLRPVPLEIALRGAAREGTTFRLGGDGDQADLVCGRFSFAGVLAPKLLKVLPPLLHIKGRQGKPLEWLRLTSYFLVEEALHSRPGSAIMIERLLDLLLIQAIRDWGSKSGENLGWLSGLRDLSIGKALSAIHQNPAREWTVEALAAIAGSSRSAFAARFSEVVGKPPLKYVAGWRLDLAADQLRAGTARISEIAETVGYGSEAALTRAFKLQFGKTPGQFRRTGMAPAKLPQLATA
ncbi:MAG: AraC family transcriptional regulator [Acidobacteriales bacterium]|nr:AraC family transcriptional regulator [Terriglobales bacterium]